MRNQFITNALLAAIIAVLVSLGYLIWKGSPRLQSIAQSSQPADNPAKTLKQDSKAAPKTGSHRRSGAASESAADRVPAAQPAPSQPQAVTHTVTVHITHPIRLGAGEDEVKKQFGQPDLQMTTQQGDLLFTTLVYLEPKSTATVARLRNGIVVAVDKSTVVAAGCLRPPCMVGGTER